MEGIINKLAKAYDRIMAGPTFAKAIPGKTNKPELIIAPEAKQNTSNKPNCFLSNKASASQSKTSDEVIAVRINNPRRENQ